MTATAADVAGFLTADPASHAQLRDAALLVADAVAAARAQERPFSGADPAMLAATIAAIDPCPEEGVELAELVAELRDTVLAHGVNVSDPRCAAHLQCPTLLPAVAAELAIGATNQSLDSFDQAPAATLVEDHLVRWLANMLGLPGGSGVLTSGGTASNLLALLLARERACEAVRGPLSGLGLPDGHAGWRIVASAAAHDSVRRSAAVIGLGAGAVVGVPTDDRGRMEMSALDETLAALARAGCEPIAIVATAGTTDLGAIDPLDAVAERAAACGAWLHVDAAVGSALALSPLLAPLLHGIERADSITADLHKLWFMPIGASALLVRDIALLAPVRHHSDYLNRAEDEADGVLNLVGRSLDTSRRFDALKILTGLRCTGRRRMAGMVEGLVELARTAARAVQEHEDLELLAEPSTVTVVFRWRPAAARLSAARLDAVNTAAQRALLRSGEAIVGRTRLDGRVALKLTLVNPLACEADVRELLELVATAARRARAHEAALDAATETLLNCYMREGGDWQAIAAESAPAAASSATTQVAVLAFEEPRATLLAPIAYLSPTGRHRFRLPVQLAVAGGRPAPVSFDIVARMLCGELVQDTDPAAVLHRIRASAEAVGAFLEARESDIDELFGAAALSFIESEHALLLGHMLHPTPKSRTEMTPAELLAYAPETAAEFRLHWLAVDPALVEHDSATGISAPELAERLLRDDPSVDGPALDRALDGLGERVLIPAHPWEIEHLRAEDDVVAALVAAGRIVDLGPLGSPVTPTTSVRTVYNAAWPWQLKFSLHVRVTNSMRVTLPKELLRAVEAARLLQTEIGRRAAAIAPDFVMLQDPAYLTVRHGGKVVDGLSVLLRENRWPAGAQADVSSLTSLCQDHPHGGRSRLGQIVAAIAAGEARSERDVAREWFARYCDVVIVPLVRLFLELGLCMEPHQQNVLVELEDGWPARGVYRDSQGYFHREAAHEDITAIIPGIGEASESVFPEALADERLVYYPFLNNALGVVNALGVAGCIDEIELLGDLRALLERERERGGRYPVTLLDRLLDDESWPCKANLRTRMHDMDELVGDIASQSAYVRIPNPLHRAGT